MVNSQAQKAIIKAKIINLVMVENGGSPIPFIWTQDEESLMRAILLSV